MVEVVGVVVMVAVAAVAMMFRGKAYRLKAVVKDNPTAGAIMSYLACRVSQGQTVKYFS